MPENHVSLYALFSNLQTQMFAKLNTARTCIPHPGIKGDTSEDCWRDMLTYLPKRYCVDKAFVIDHKENVSDQIDIVIYDRQYSPFIFRQDSAIYVPAESVYAVIEVKQELSKGMLEYAAEKACSVRKLKRTNAHFGWAQGTMKRGEPLPIMAGIVTLSSAWSPALGEPFQFTIRELAKDHLKRMDFGCAVEGGAFDLNIGNTCDPDLYICEGEMTLMTFFLKLVARLQFIGTVPAIDVNSYLAAIESKQ